MRIIPSNVDKYVPFKHEFKGRGGTHSLTERITQYCVSTPEGYTPRATWSFTVHESEDETYEKAYEVLCKLRDEDPDVDWRFYRLKVVDHIMEIKG